MRARLLFLLLPLWATTPLAQAQTTPRQLNTLPSLPDSTRQQPARRPAPTPAAVPVPAPAAITGSDVAAPTAPSRYSVGLKNGQVYRVYDVEVKQPVFGRSFLLLDGQQRLDMSEVKYYDDETGHYVRAILPGSSRETTLRRDKIGRISLYSILSSQYAGNYGGYGPGYGRYGGYGYGGYGMGGPVYRTVKTEYFTKDNGPVQDMSVKNLALATADNPASTALLLDARRYQRYATASYVAAGGLLVAGLVSSLRNDGSGPSVSPLMFAALPFSIIPVIVQSKQQRNIKQAIALYNRAQ
ncbi:hypothetical protein [Hymenobacter persicinus]|uniref:hypothetical protein n=1 Tax=Hymenobacter persicinus TaxID=2025506 RepID=UPI001A91D683|nr:hypothetical protein [Hymenobacter persicinus]